MVFAIFQYRAVEHIFETRLKMSDQISIEQYVGILFLPHVAKMLEG